MKPAPTGVGENLADAGVARAREVYMRPGAPMGHDIFLSHSSTDKAFADAVCARLERDGFRCWIAPRDIAPGRSYGEAIIHGISECRAMLVILSSDAIASRQVLQEVERAASKGLRMLPVRLEDVKPGEGLEYFLASWHWLDVCDQPMDMALDTVAGAVGGLLGAPSAGAIDRGAEGSRGETRLSLRSLLALSFSVWWRNFFKFAVLALVGTLPALTLFIGIALLPLFAFLLQQQRLGHTPTSDEVMAQVNSLWQAKWAVAALTALCVYPVIVVITGALTWGVFHHLARRPVYVGDMIAAGFWRSLPLLGAGFVAAVMILGGAVLLVVPGLVIAAAVSVAFPVVVVEKIGPIKAIKRSWALTRGHRRTLLEAAAVLCLVTLIAYELINQQVSGLVAIVFVSLPALLPAVAYLELRAIEEGIPTQDMAKVLTTKLSE